MDDKQNLFLQISRVSKAGSDDEIQVSICGGNASIRLAVDFASFTDMITSGAMRPCEVKRWVVGQEIPCFKETSIIVDNNEKK